MIKPLQTDRDSTPRLGSHRSKREMVSVADAAATVIGELCGRLACIGTDRADARTVEGRRRRADVRRLANLIGWAPPADWRRGVAKLLVAEMPAA